MKVLWISSYPKSGNTWVNNLLYQAGKELGYPPEGMDVYNVMKSNKLPSVCPIINNKVSEEAPIVLKTHAAFADNMHQNLNLETVGFIHVIRNPLDVLLSYINFSRIDYRLWGDREACAKRFFIDFLGFDNIIPYDDWLNTKLDDIPRENLDHALKIFSAGNGKIPNVDQMSGNWFEHTESYFKVEKNMPSVTLKYEDLLQDSNTFLDLQAIFDINSETILGAVDVINKRNADFSREGEGDRGIFYNKMSSYYYLNYFSSDVIAAFLKEHNEQLKAFGYDNLPSS
jgi:hypothetical protein